MLIVNPFSGRGLAKQTLGLIVSLFCEAEWAVSVFTTHQYLPEFLAREYSRHFDLVVCVGGDGTLSGVAAGLMQAGLNLPVGYIPHGTANDMAATLALPRDPKAAVTAVLCGTPVPVDIGQFGERYFTYIAAFGAFTGVSYKTTQSAKRALGQLAYVLGGLASMAEIRPRHAVIEYDDGVVEGDYIFGGVTNSTSIAGLVHLDSEEVDLGDGLFEVILVRKPVTALELGDIITSFLNQTHDNEKVTLLHTKRIKFTFDTEIEWTLDGEDGGKHRSIEIFNRQQALKIIV